MNAPLPATATFHARPLALPDDWIERLFSKLSALYGSKFSDLWRGTDAVEVKALWASKLAGFYQIPGCIKAALDACDDRPWPPTLPEFLGLCRDAARRNGTATTALSPPYVGKEEAVKIIKNLTTGQMYGKTPHPLEWARILRQKYLDGINLLPVQINLASGALNEVWKDRQCFDAKDAA